MFMRRIGRHNVPFSGPVEKVEGGGVIWHETYFPSRRENLQTFLEGVALRFSANPVLVAGPYVGEFGHEIMDFQSYVRALKPRYREVHVITFPGREPLYRGCIVHAHDFDLKTAGYTYGRISNQEARRYLQRFAGEHHLERYDVFGTMHLRTRWHRRLLFRQEHEIIRPLRPVEPGSKIVFHFRNIDKQGPDKNRNFRPELAAETVRLCRQAGFEPACIGHPQYALCPEGCEDRRTEDLEATIAQIAASRLVVGELSGPLHLAVYCARPVAIWAPDPWRIAGALRRNPFQAKIFVIRDDTTNPQPNEILDVVKTAAVALSNQKSA
jgi:hypothetical protein